MRVHFGHGPGQGNFDYHEPFGHHGPFGHNHGPFGHNHGPFGHNHGPLGQHEFFGQHQPFGPPGFSDRACGPCRHRGSGDHGFYGRPEGIGKCGFDFGHRRGHGPGPYERRCDAKEDEQCCQDQERRGRRGPSPDRRHGHHGPQISRQDRGDHCRCRPHSDGDDEEPRCGRERGSHGPYGRGGPNHFRCHGPPDFGRPEPFRHVPFEPPGCFRPHGNRLHCGSFGRFERFARPRFLDRPGRSSKRPHNSEDESGNESGCARRNRRSCLRGKDDNRDTVLVQRIVVEKTPRCYSV